MSTPNLAQNSTYRRCAELYVLTVDWRSPLFTSSCALLVQKRRSAATLLSETNYVAILDQS